MQKRVRNRATKRPWWRQPRHPRRFVISKKDPELWGAVIAGNVVRALIEEEPEALSHYESIVDAIPCQEDLQAPQAAAVIRRIMGGEQAFPWVEIQPVLDLSYTKFHRRSLEIKRDPHLSWTSCFDVLTKLVLEESPSSDAICEMAHRFADRFCLSSPKVAPVLLLVAGLDAIELDTRDVDTVRATDDPLAMAAFGQEPTSSQGRKAYRAARRSFREQMNDADWPRNAVLMEQARMWVWARVTLQSNMAAVTRWYATKHSGDDKRIESWDAVYRHWCTRIAEIDRALAIG